MNVSETHAEDRARCAVAVFVLAVRQRRAAQAPAEIRRGAGGRLREVQGPQGRRERRLHPGARQGGSEPLRHRAGHRRTARSTPRATSQSEVSIQSISKVFTHGEGDGGAGAGGHREQHRRRRHRAGASTRSSRSSSTRRAEMNAVVNPGAITATSMVKGATRGRDVEQHPRHPQRLRRAAAVGQPGGLQVRGRHQPAQPGHRRC